MEKHPLPLKRANGTCIPQHPMNPDPLDSLAQLETDLWQAADNLRANSGLASSEYCMPVLGVIFLRHAANRFEAATRQIQEDQATGRMPKRAAIKADYLKRRALLLPGCTSLPSASAHAPAKPHSSWRSRTMFGLCSACFGMPPMAARLSSCSIVVPAFARAGPPMVQAAWRTPPRWSPTRYASHVFRWRR